MIKQLIKQIWNERKSNSWLWIELLLVFVFLWYIVDTVYTTARVYYEPVGFDITDTYLIDFSNKTSKSSSYIPEEENSATSGENLLEILERLKQLPEVEDVSVSVNARPYTGSNSGYRFTIDTLSLYALSRPITPSFFNVFRYQPAAESQGISLIDALKEGHVVVSENILPETYKGDRRLMNRTLVNANDSTDTRIVSAVTKKVRYNDFWQNYGDRYVAFVFTEKQIAQYDLSWLEICMRVKPGTPKDFAEKLMEMSDTRFSVGNVFMLKVQSFADIRDNFQISSYNSIKTDLWMLTFLLVNIFLGIIGTFWFRTQYRRSEIGLRMAAGASRRSIWKLLTSEGVMLLILATIPAMIICFSVGKTELINKWQVEWGAERFLIGTSITFVLMAIMIIIGIWYPARQAMKIEPAEALHAE